MQLHACQVTKLLRKGAAGHAFKLLVSVCNTQWRTILIGTSEFGWCHINDCRLLYFRYAGKGYKVLWMFCVHKDNALPACV